MTGTLRQRLYAGFAITESGCWEWKRCVNSRGYSCISENGIVMLGHRVSYELHRGPIPTGLQIDHLCRNKACVNPDHLEAVTGIENHHRRPDINKTHCLRGHELAGDNLITRTKSNGHAMRNCRTCARDRRRERTARETAARRLERAS